MNKKLLKVIENENVEIVEKLIYNNADVNYVGHSGNISLHLVCFTGNCQLLKIILNANANVNAINQKLQTPLMISSQFGFIKQVQILIINKADINRQDLCGISSLMFAFEYNLPKIALELLNSRADVNLRNRNGNHDFFCLKKTSLQDIRISQFMETFPPSFKNDPHLFVKKENLQENDLQSKYLLLINAMDQKLQFSLPVK